MIKKEYLEPEFEARVAEDFQRVVSIVDQKVSEYPNVEKLKSNLDGAIYNYKKFSFRVKEERYRNMLELDIYDRNVEINQRISMYEPINKYHAIVMDNISKELKWHIPNQPYQKIPLNIKSCIETMIVIAIHYIDEHSDK